METRNLKLTLEQAKSLLEKQPELADIIYNSFPELKPKPLVLDKWEDLNELKGYYINANSEIEKTDCSICNFNLNVFATEKQAKSALAYAQLTQLMQATGNCDVDYNNANKYKYSIERYINGIRKSYLTHIYHPLTFNTSKIRDEFFDKHQELIKQFFQLD